MLAFSSFVIGFEDDFSNILKQGKSYGCESSFGFYFLKLSERVYDRDKKSLALGFFS